MQRKLKKYLAFIWVSGIIAGFGMMYIINYTDPRDTMTGLQNVLVFYGLLIILTLTIASLCGFYLRKTFSQREKLLQHLASSFRQGIWISVFVSSSIFLLSQGLYNLANSVLLASALVFLELYLNSRKKWTQN